MKIKIVPILCLLLLHPTALANTEESKEEKKGEKTCGKLEKTIIKGETEGYKLSNEMKKATNGNEWCYYRKQYVRGYKNHLENMIEYARCKYLADDNPDYKSYEEQHEFNEQRHQEMVSNTLLACPYSM